MIEQSLYNIAKRRHRQLNRDVVHDLYCKFGSDLPSMAYLSTCISHAKPQEMQQEFELCDEVLDPHQDSEHDINFNNVYGLVSSCINTVRAKYELEVDTFLECHVNGDYKSFESRSGISRTVLEKICKFARHEILKEFNRRQ